MRKNKEIKLLSPMVFEGYIPSHKGIDNAGEKFTYLHVPTDAEDFLENDINAGAVQYKPCMDFLKGQDTDMVIILCDNQQEGLKAVTYIAAGLGFSTADYDDEVSEPREEDIAEIEYDNNIPIIPIEELLTYESNAPVYASKNEMVFNFNVDQKKQDPYWIKYTGDICIIDRCIEDDNGNIALMSHEIDPMIVNPENIYEWHKYFKRFKGNGKIYLILEKGKAIHELFYDRVIEYEKCDDEDELPFYGGNCENDMSLSSLILRYTAELVDINAPDKLKAKYYENMFKSYIKKYSFTIKRRTPLKNILKNICRLDENTYEAMECVLRYIRHKNPKLEVITQEDFVKTGVLKNVLKKSANKGDKKQNEIKLDDLVGMEDVKRQFESIVNSIKFNMERKRRGLPTMDYRNIFLLIGAPGTAKTSMANILGRRMKEEHILKGTRFGSFSGAQLKGQFVGQTAPKVHEIFENYDIIIIDEAYSLTASMNGGMDIYSQEALAQLAIELENHGHDRLVFFAGYGGSDMNEKNNKMKEFLDSNPGIKSRINSTIVFPSYDEGQMVEITKGIAQRYDFVFEEGALDEIKDYFSKRVMDENFGNGREARSFVDNCQMALAERVMNMPSSQKTKKMMQIITKKDVEMTINKLSEANSNQYGYKARFGFM